MSPYQRLAELGLELPVNPEPIANFLAHAEGGGLVFLSGQGPLGTDGRLHTGKVGADLDVREAYEHARITGLNLLAVMHGALGDLGRVKRVVKLLGFVNATPDFTDHPAVVNGCSDLLVAVLGARGAHARSAIGVASLPRNISVEVEAVIEIEGRI
jgi:enamine deaminase RidA (YjgF/YER057c/UK114 family)